MMHKPSNIDLAIGIIIIKNGFNILKLLLRLSKDDNGTVALVIVVMALVVVFVTMVI